MQILQSLMSSVIDTAPKKYLASTRVSNFSLEKISQSYMILKKIANKQWRTQESSKGRGGNAFEISDEALHFRQGCVSQAGVWGQSPQLPEANGRILAFFGKNNAFW